MITGLAKWLIMKPSRAVLKHLVAPAAHAGYKATSYAAGKASVLPYMYLRDFAKADLGDKMWMASHGLWAYENNKRRWGDVFNARDYINNYTYGRK